MNFQLNDSISSNLGQQDKPFTNIYHNPFQHPQQINIQQAKEQLNPCKEEEIQSSRKEEEEEEESLGLTPYKSEEDNLNDYCFNEYEDDDYNSSDEEEEQQLLDENEDEVDLKQPQIDVRDDINQSMIFLPCASKLEKIKQEYYQHESVEIEVKSYNDALVLNGYYLQNKDSRFRMLKPKSESQFDHKIVVKLRQNIKPQVVIRDINDVNNSLFQKTVYLTKYQFLQLRHSRKLQQEIYDKFQVNFAFNINYLHQSNPDPQELYFILYSHKREAKFIDAQKFILQQELVKIYLLTQSNYINSLKTNDFQHRQYLANLRMQVFKEKFDGNQFKFIYEIVDLSSIKSILYKQSILVQWSSFRSNYQNLLKYFDLKIYWSITSKSRLQGTVKHKTHYRIEQQESSFQTIFLSNYQEFDETAKDMLNVNKNICEKITLQKREFNIDSDDNFEDIVVQQDNLQAVFLKIDEIAKIIKRSKSNPQKLQKMITILEGKIQSQIDEQQKWQSHVFQKLERQPSRKQSGFPKTNLLSKKSNSFKQETRLSNNNKDLHQDLGAKRKSENQIQQQTTKASSQQSDDSRNFNNFQNYQNIHFDNQSQKAERQEQKYSDQQQYAFQQPIFKPPIELMQNLPEQINSNNTNNFNNSNNQKIGNNLPKMLKEEQKQNYAGNVQATAPLENQKIKLSKEEQKKIRTESISKKKLLDEKEFCNTDKDLEEYFQKIKRKKPDMYEIPNPDFVKTQNSQLFQASFTDSEFKLKDIKDGMLNESNIFIFLTEQKNLIKESNCYYLNNEFKGLPCYWIKFG